MTSFWSRRITRRAALATAIAAVALVPSSAAASARHPQRVADVAAQLHITPAQLAHKAGMNTRALQRALDRYHARMRQRGLHAPRAKAASGDAATFLSADSSGGTCAGSGARSNTALADGKYYIGGDLTVTCSPTVLFSVCTMQVRFDGHPIIIAPAGGFNTCHANVGGITEFGAGEQGILQGDWQAITDGAFRDTYNSGCLVLQQYAQCQFFSAYTVPMSDRFPWFPSA